MRGKEKLIFYKKNDFNEIAPKYVELRFRQQQIEMILLLKLLLMIKAK